jgi:hypothetical protein
MLLTAVEVDYRGDIIDCHEPEAPTRLSNWSDHARRHALNLVIRCARDSMPQLRLIVLNDVAKHPDSLLIDFTCSDFWCVTRKKSYVTTRRSGSAVTVWRTTSVSIR